MITGSSSYTTKNALGNRVPVYRVVLSERRGTTVVTDATFHWKLDELTGGRADSMSLAAHLTMTGTVGYTTGKLKNAAVFTVGANYLSLADQSTIRTGPQDWSFSGWVQLVSKTDYMGIAAKTSGTVGQREWQLWLDQPADRFTFTLYYAAGATPVVVTANNLGSPAVGTWYHIAIRHIQATKTIGIKINNGTEDTNTYVGTANAGASSFYIGVDYAASGKVIDGYIDEAGLWIGHALTDAEITALYNAGSALAIKNYKVDREVVDVATASPLGGEDIGTEILIPMELSKQAEIDKYRFPLSEFSFLLQDLGQAATAIVGAGIVGYRCDLYQGFYPLAWSGNYVQLFSGTIAEIVYDSGSYRVTARSPIAAGLDKVLFSGAASRLNGAISDVSTTLTLVDASAFDDASTLPESAVRVVMCDDEIFTYRNKSGNILSLMQRSGANGYLIPPRGGPSASHSDGALVREMPKLGGLSATNDELSVYREQDLHPIELLKSVFDGVGKYGFGEAHVEYNETEFAEAKAALGTNLKFRFLHDAPANAKRFIEEEFYLPLAAYPTEDEQGRIGIKLFDAYPEPLTTLSDADIEAFPRWLRNAEKIINVVTYHYDYSPVSQEYTSTYTYKDQSLISALGRESVLEIFSKGIRGYAQNIAGTQNWFNDTAAFLENRAKAHIARFGSVAPILGVRTKLSKSLLECGDELAASFSQAINLGLSLRRIVNMPFEVSLMRADFQSNRVDLELLGFPDVMPIGGLAFDVTFGPARAARRRRRRSPVADDFIRPRTLY